MKCRRRLRCRQERLSDEFGQPLFVRTAVSFGIRDSRRRKSCRAALSHQNGGGERQNGRSWGAAETGAGGAKAEATGAGQKDVGRDRSRGAGRGCGTAACTVRTRTLPGVRERLGDEGTERRGRWNGRSWGAAETGAGGAKAEATGTEQKDAGTGTSRTKKGRPEP